jgi:hypothetical protein
MSVFALTPRALVATVATLALLATSAVEAGTPIEMTVKAGRWQGITWRLTAGTWSDGSYCVAMTIEGRENGRSCGSIRRDRMSYLAAIGRPDPNYVVGPVIATARSVQITFFDRVPVRISTITPPRGLAPGTRFFAVLLRCPATPRHFIARDTAGRIVAQLVAVHPRRPRAHC